MEPVKCGTVALSAGPRMPVNGEGLQRETCGKGEPEGWRKASRHRPERPVPGKGRQSLFGGDTEDRVRDSRFGGVDNHSSCWCRSLDSAGVVADRELAGVAIALVTPARAARQICGRKGSWGCPSLGYQSKMLRAGQRDRGRHSRCLASVGAGTTRPYGSRCCQSS